MYHIQSDNEKLNPPFAKLLLVPWAPHLAPLMSNISMPINLNINNVSQGAQVEPSHIITEHLGLEGIFQDHLVQPSCNEQGHLPLGQVAQSLSNSNSADMK